MNGLAGLLPILLLGVVFWAMLIRPQQRARANQRSMQTQLSPGDEVSTIGGVYGIVRDIDDATVDLEISEDVIVRFDRRAVSRIMRDVPAEQADQYRIETDDLSADESAEDHDDDAHQAAAAETPEAAAEPELDGSHEAADAPGSTR